MKRQIQLVDELQSTVSACGINGAIDALRQYRMDKFGAEAISYVFSTVNKALKISNKELEQNSWTDNRKIAFGFYGYFLHHIFNYTFFDIQKSIPIKVNQRFIYNHARMIKTAKIINPKTDIDKTISLHIETLKENFTNYKKQIFK